jgi:hypothetical protein
MAGPSPPSRKRIRNSANGNGNEISSKVQRVREPEEQNRSESENENGSESENENEIALSSPATPGEEAALPPAAPAALPPAAPAALPPPAPAALPPAAAALPPAADQGTVSLNALLNGDPTQIIESMQKMGNLQRSYVISEIYHRLNTLLYHLANRANDIRKNDRNVQLSIDYRVNITEYLNEFFSDPSRITNILYHCTKIPVCVHTRNGPKQISETSDEMNELGTAVYTQMNSLVRVIIIEIRDEINQYHGQSFTTKDLRNTINKVLSKYFHEDTGHIMNVPQSDGSQLEVTIQRTSKAIFTNVLMYQIESNIYELPEIRIISSTTIEELKRSCRQMMIDAHSLTVTEIQNILANPGYTVLSAADTLTTAVGNFNAFLKTHKIGDMVFFPQTVGVQQLPTAILNVSFNALSRLTQGLAQCGKAIDKTFRQISDGTLSKRVIKSVEMMFRGPEDTALARIKTMQNLDEVNREINKINRFINEIDDSEQDMAKFLQQNPHHAQPSFHMGTTGRNGRKRLSRTRSRRNERLTKSLQGGGGKGMNQKTRKQSRKQKQQKKSMKKQGRQQKTRKSVALNKRVRKVQKTQKNRRSTMQQRQQQQQQQQQQQKKK